MNDLISIVLPIYNVENYLKKCIETVLNQTYTNIEILLVDDGSTDHSGAICDEFEKKDKRIKVIHKSNGGLSDARNTGLKQANGKYISFIDSDDYVSEKYVEELYYLIKKNEAQIAVCNFQRVKEDGQVISSEDIKSETLSSKEVLEKLNDKKFYPVSIVAWNKLYDIKLFENILYPIGKLHEDEYTTYKLYYEAKKIVVTSSVLYYYRTVQTSITNRNFNKTRLDVLEALEERMRFFKEKNEKKLYELSLIQYESVLMIHYLNCKFYLEDSKEIQDEILNKYKQNYAEAIHSKECSLINKMKFMIAYQSPMLYYNIKKIIKGRK